jgi:hypothetical protein
VLELARVMSSGDSRLFEVLSQPVLVKSHPVLVKSQPVLMWSHDIFV